MPNVTSVDIKYINKDNKSVNQIFEKNSLARGMLFRVQ